MISPPFLSANPDLNSRFEQIFRSRSISSSRTNRDRSNLLRTGRVDAAFGLTQETMERRLLVAQPKMSVMDHERIWNHLCPDPWANMGPGSFMHPSESIAVCGPNPMAYNNPLSAANYPVFPNFSLEVPCYIRANAGMTQEPYIHYSSGRTSNPFTPYYVQHEPCFNLHTVGDINGTANPPTGYDIATYKRKFPTIQIFPESGSTNGSHSAGSSSNHPVSTGHLESARILGPHCPPWDPISMVPSYRSNNLLSSEEDQRNTRSPHANVLHPQNISLTVHSSSNFSDHFHSVANNSGLNVPGQWNHAPSSVDSHTLLMSSEISSFNHEMNQLHGRHVTNNTSEIDGRRNFSLIHRPMHDLVDRSVYGQITSYRVNPSYRSMGSEANLVDFRLPAVESVVPPRYSWQLPTTGHANERNGRLRTPYDGEDDMGHNRWVSEAIVVMDRSTFYDSSNLFDEHHDMRLDIDHMSYEELLALEERIGNVNTGLADVAVSRCLMEITYCSDQIVDDLEEGRCTICLESYVDRDCLGRLNCGHDFHACCIKKWLLIKNACPICKASALDDSLTEQ